MLTRSRCLSFELTEARDVTPLLAPVFHHIYGPIDAMFLLLFLYLAWAPHSQRAAVLKGD
jgi:hypothetical protein